MALEFLDTCEVVICAGAGGVGKTTTAAALGAVAARRGRRVAVVTIDPARRLADSLGLDTLCNTPQSVAPEWWHSEEHPAIAHVPGGQLVVMMLDTRRTFDNLVTRHTTNAALRHRILSNPLYHHLSTNLAGVHEYMALEKLQELQLSDQFDLVILDTPPARNTVDFLTAPQRLVEALDGKVMQWLTRSLRSRERGRAGLVGSGISQLLALMGRITGQGLLEQMAQLIVDLDDVLGGVRQRATSVSQALRQSSLQFVLVASPQRESSEEAVKLAQYLESQGMAVGAFLMNRVHALVSAVEGAPLDDFLRDNLPDLPEPERDSLAHTVFEVARQAETIAKDDDRAVQMLRGETRRRLAKSAPVLSTPDVTGQGRETLNQLANALEACLHRPGDADPESARSAELTET